MGKLLLIYLCLFCTITFFVSCKKCVTCKAYDRTDNSVKDQHEYCGPKAETDESEKDYIQIWNNTQTFAECK